MKNWLPVVAFTVSLGVGIAGPATAAGARAKAPARPKAPAPPAAAQSPPPAAGGKTAPKRVETPPTDGPAAASTALGVPAKAPVKPAKLPPAMTRIHQPGTVVATVNGEAITMAQLVQQLVLLGGPQIVDRIVQERIIRQEARKQGVVVSEKEIQEKVDQNLKEFKARLGTEERFQEYLTRQRRTPETFRDVMRPGIELNLLQEKLREKVTASAVVTDKEISDAYESQKRLHVEPETAKVSHILIAVNSADADADQKAKARAEEALAKVKAGDGQNFAEVAREYSDDAETKEKGGEMVPIRRPSFYGLTFDQAIFSGSPGVLPEVVRSIRGWHVLYLHEKSPERQKPLEEVQEQIKNQLLTRRRAELFRTYMQDAEKNARTDVKVQF
jgi:foldase protein PrsA